MCKLMVLYLYQDLIKWVYLYVSLTSFFYSDEFINDQNGEMLAFSKNLIYTVCKVKNLQVVSLLY